ncbi:hypothetical protein ACSS6W_006178 [Trichoderma asperelloides]
MAQDQSKNAMAKTPPQSYLKEVHDIYLGKNPRLADPNSFSAPSNLFRQVQQMKDSAMQEILDNPDEPPDLYVELQRRWGWGVTIRYPPGGPYVQFNEYEKAMEQMTREIFETWNKIKTIVSNYEPDIQSFIRENYPKEGDGEWSTNDRLWAILRDWEQTVAKFNDCHPDIKRFMEAKYTESDFLIQSPTDEAIISKAPLRYLLRYFQEGETIPLSENERDMHRAIYNHAGNFFETSTVKEWPMKEEPKYISLGPYMCNAKDSRVWDRTSRISFLAPHIISEDLLSFEHLVSVIHYRGRYHPSIFTKLDNDMTFIGRRTNNLTGPLLANRMVSFDTSNSGYRPKFWFGWEGEISRPKKFKDAEDEKTWNATAEEYNDLWRRGQLFEPSGAWIMLQNQRVTYLYMLNVLTTICQDMSLDYEKTRHMLYFDLMRGVLRRSIFEFYIWNSILTRLEEFEDLLYEEFPDYGKRDAPKGDGIDLLQQPPRFLPTKKPDNEKGPENRKKSRHDILTEKYLSLVTMVRYHAIYFVNEFRKKGIHASAPPMRDLSFAIGDTHSDTQDAKAKGKKRQSQQTTCKIEKRHYGAPDLIYHSKLLDPSHDNTLCGIKEVANYLYGIASHSDGDFDYKGNPIITDFIRHIIGGLDILSSLADHLESLWPAMDILGGAATDESSRLRYFHSGSGDISINFFDFDSFDKIPRERLERVFLFFDELQGFKEESISVGHAKGDMKRFGASLLRDFIIPLNNGSGPYYANNEKAISSRLEEAMGISRDDCPFEKGEKPFNLEQEEAGPNKTVPLESQMQDYRFIAQYEKDLAEERQSRRNKLLEDLLGPSKEDRAKEKRRMKKQARRHNKARQRLKASGELLSGDEDNGAEDSSQNNRDSYSRWGESLHATLRQFSLPPVPKTRILLVPDISALAINTSSEPLPAAPDGLPKGIIKKRDWATLESIYGVHGNVNAAVTYMEVKSAMNAMGYEEFGGRGGSHMSFSRKNGRWPHGELPRGENILMPSTHGMKSALAAKGKSRDWGRRLCQRGLTFDLITKWYVKG